MPSLMCTPYSIHTSADPMTTVHPETSCLLFQTQMNINTVHPACTYYSDRVNHNDSNAILIMYWRKTCRELRVASSSCFAADITVGERRELCQSLTGCGDTWSIMHFRKLNRNTEDVFLPTVGEC